MSRLLTYRGTVYPWHCDHMGHMNVMWYAGKFDEATWQLAGALGLTAEALATAGRGLVAAEQHTTYRAELLAGELLCIRSGIDEVGTRSFRFTHAMHKEPSGVLAATCTLVGVHIDRATRKAVPFSAEVIDALRSKVPCGI